MGSSLNTITVDGVTYDRDTYTQAKNAASKAVNNNSVISKDVFLQLLVTQMQFQDPLDPMDNSEYLAQLAQFSALEQMTNVAGKLEDVYSLVENIDTSVLVGSLGNMIGKTAQWATTVNGVTTTTEGVITGVSISDGTPSLIATVKDAQGHEASTKVSISDITRIGESA